MMQEAAQHSRDQGATGGQLALWLGLLVAIIALTTAMGQIERGANRIYGIERDRPALRKYGQPLLMALTSPLLLLLGFLVIIAGDALGESLAAVYGWSRHHPQTLWRFGRWPVGVILAWASFTVVLERAPRRLQPGYSWLAFGSGVSLALWLLVTGLLALYVAKGASFGTTYGPLTGIFALLLWANLSSVALFLGVAFAAQLEAVRAGVPAPKLADPLTTEGRADAATAGGVRSPNLEPRRQQGATSGAEAELCNTAPLAIAQRPARGTYERTGSPARREGVDAVIRRKVHRTPPDLASALPSTPVWRRSSASRPLAQRHTDERRRGLEGFRSLRLRVGPHPAVEDARLRSGHGQARPLQRRNRAGGGTGAQLALPSEA